MEKPKSVTCRAEGVRRRFSKGTAAFTKKSRHHTARPYMKRVYILQNPSTKHLPPRKTDFPVSASYRRRPAFCATTQKPRPANGKRNLLKVIKSGTNKKSYGDSVRRFCSHFLLKARECEFLASGLGFCFGLWELSTCWIRLRLGSSL